VVRAGVCRLARLCHCGRVLSVGHRLGNYEVVRFLGAGGQGAVYLCRHVRLDRLDAVKVLPRYLGDADGRLRFEREAASAARLRHPNLVTVHDAGEAADGSFYVAMEYVDGPSLSIVIKEKLITDPGKMIRILGQVADALDVAHGAGLVHRDVKPANILVADPDLDTPKAYLVDFGIAKLVSAGDAMTSQIMGTYAYMPPERLDGRSGTGRSDQYSLACTAYHWLVGEVPYPEDSPMAVMRAHTDAPPPRASVRGAGVPAGVDAVLARGMAKAPEDRYATCTEFVEALASALTAPARAEKADKVNAAQAAPSRPAEPKPQPVRGVAPPRPTRPPTPGPHPVMTQPPVPGQRTGGTTSAGRMYRSPPWWQKALLPLGAPVSVGVAWVALPNVRKLIETPDQFGQVLIVYTVLSAAVMTAGGMGAWLMMFRRRAAWLGTAISVLSAPVLALVAEVGRAADLPSLGRERHLFATPPDIFDGYKGRTLVVVGVLLGGLCIYGARRWGDGLERVTRVPRDKWPWWGGLVGILAVGGAVLLGPRNTLLALALAALLVALYGFAQGWFEAWWLFTGAQAAFVMHGLLVGDYETTTVYYVVAVAVGCIGAAIWFSDVAKDGR
jgi:serine/threonine protein kinase